MRVTFFWTYIVGPFAALLPMRWKRALPAVDRVNWERAGAISGVLELCLGIVGMAFWYMRAMAPMVNSGSESALLGKFGREVGDSQIAGVALAVFATHPLTLMFAYLFFEGGLRWIGAAFMEDVRGTFPLYLVERAIFLSAHPREARTMAQEARQIAAATVERLRERAMVARLQELPDELHYSKRAAEELLEIWACRRKEDWAAPKITRVDEIYYRLEESWVEKGSARPFRYRLRRLEAGVPGRNVIVYKSGPTGVKHE
jgi:hypothetical protein